VIPDLLDGLFTRTWWRYATDDGGWFGPVYHWFNIVEGCFWVVFAVLVLRRYARHRKSRAEIGYAIAFAVFAATDFREAWVQSSPLIWFKLANLIVLLWLRRSIMARFHPDAKVY
jgi:hypothetical protein